MSIVNQKRTLFAGFLSLASIVIMASCANDTGSSSTKEQTSSADTTAMASADSSAGAKAPAKKRKGKGSAIFSVDNAAKVEKDKDGVYSRAEKMPEYPGGEKALSTFVENNITYPDNAVDQNMEGTVTVSFVVDEKGKVVNPVATGNTIGSGLEDEAVKVVKQMPDWKPGMVKGKPVKTRLSLPVTFKLADA